MDNPLAEPSGVSPADGQLLPPRHPGVAREQGCEYDNDVRPRSQPEWPLREQPNWQPPGRFSGSAHTDVQSPRLMTDCPMLHRFWGWTRPS